MQYVYHCPCGAYVEVECPPFRPEPSVECPRCGNEATRYHLPLAVTYHGPGWTAAKAGAKLTDYQRTYLDGGRRGPKGEAL